MSGYHLIRSENPPLLRVIDGQLYVEITFDGGTTVRAGVGDGAWFFSQVVAKLVDPALKARLVQAAFVPKGD